MKLVALYTIEKPSHAGVVSGLYRCLYCKHYDNFYLGIPIFLAITGLAAILLGLE